MQINTRTDLDSITGTPDHAAFIAQLKGSLFATADVREYPEGYDATLKPTDEGYLAPILGQVADDSMATRYRFTRAEVEAL